MIFSQPSQTTSRESLACRVATASRAMAVIIALPMSLLVLPSVTHAQQWVLLPEIEVGAQYIDNPRLRENGPVEDITGGLLDVAAAFHRNTETSSILIRPSAAVYRYSGDSNEDSEAYFFDFNGEKLGQRSTWFFKGNYRQQQVFRGETTSSEIDDVGIDDSVQTGTGRTFERRQRDMWRLGPGFTFEFTERTALKVELNYLDVQYDVQEADEAIDYTNGRADVSIVRTLSEGTILEFGVFGSKYEPDAVSRDTESVGARLRYEKDVSDISTFFVDLGAQDSEIQSVASPGSDLSETSFLWNLGYRRQLELTQWTFDVGQSVTPSGSGALVERDLYRVIMRHQFKPRWSLELAGVLMNTDTLSRDDVVTASRNERDYLRGNAALAWQMTPNWTIESLYMYTYQDFADIEGDAQEHEVRLSLVYRPPVPTQ